MTDEDKGAFVCAFLELLKVPETGKPLHLMDWQRDMVMRFYSEVNDAGMRTYRYLYLEIPKKNGKSGIASGLGLYHTFMDGERAGEVYVVAADRDNAGIVFNSSVAMLEMCPALKKRAKIIESMKIIKDTVSGTVYKVLSSEAYSKHGYKPSCVIFDELHAQPNRELWDIMTFGAGAARQQPCWIVLTTAGDDPNRNSIGWEVHEKARGILEARKGNPDYQDNPTWLPIMYGYDGDDIFNEENWKKANPSIGTTISLETVRQEALDAKQSPGVERLFRWLRLNQWISVKEVGWLPLDLWDGTMMTGTRDTLMGKKCYMGMDLSTTNDLTAVTLVFPPQQGVEKWTTLFEAWIPSEKIREREHRDKVPFRQWHRDGYLHITDGDAIDYDVIENRIGELNKLFKIQSIGTDPWNSRMLTQHLMEQGMDVVEISQTMAGMSPAMKDIERLLRKKDMVHENNPAARWCFGNVRIATDGNENMKPMKNKSVDRIDIAVSWIVAVAMTRQKENMERSVYEIRTPRFISFG